MANIGLKNFWYGKMDDTKEGVYTAPAVLAGAIKASCDIKLADGELYSDDSLADSISEFSSGTLKLTIDDDDDTKFAVLLGNTQKTLTTPEATTEVVQKADDSPQFVGFAHIVTKRINKKTKYKVEMFPKVKFAPYATDAQTKEDKIEFQKPEIEGTIYTMADGTWERHATFETEANALTYLKSLFPTTAA